MDWWTRRKFEALRQREAERAIKRQQMIETYAQWHPREWLESLSYAELVAWKNAGRLDRPTLPTEREEA